MLPDLAKVSRRQPGFLTSEHLARVALRFLPTPLLAVTIGLRLSLAALAWTAAPFAPAEWMAVAAEFIARLGLLMACWGLLAHFEAVLGAHVLRALELSLGLLRNAVETAKLVGIFLLALFLALFVWEI